jgi:hypothetical protein
MLKFLAHTSKIFAWPYFIRGVLCRSDRYMCYYNTDNNYIYLSKLMNVVIYYSRYDRDYMTVHNNGNFVIDRCTVSDNRSIFEIVQRAYKLSRNLP